MRLGRACRLTKVDLLGRSTARQPLDNRKLGFLGSNYLGKHVIGHALRVAGGAENSVALQPFFALVLGHAGTPAANH